MLVKMVAAAMRGTVVVIPALKGHLDHRGFPALPDHKDHKVSQVLRDQWEQLALREQRELLV